MSGVGLSGSHGAGKSTLAQAYAETYDIPFVASQASQVIKEAGFDPSADYDFETRLHLQGLVLDAAIESYNLNKHQPFITDRTPLDFLTYLYTDVNRNNVSNEVADKFFDYERRCFATVNRYFNVVIVVQPGIELIAREGRGSPNKAYVEHFNATLCGLCSSGKSSIQFTFIPRQVTDLEKRVNAVEESMGIAQNSFNRVVAKKCTIHHSVFSKSKH